MCALLSFHIKCLRGVHVLREALVTKCTEAELATVSGCLHAYQTRRADFWQAGSVASCIMSLALTLMQLAY